MDCWHKEHKDLLWHFHMFRLRVDVVKASCLECQTAMTQMLQQVATMTATTTMTTMMGETDLAAQHRESSLALWPLHVRYKLVHISAFHRSICRLVIGYSLDCMAHTHTQSKPTPLWVFSSICTFILWPIFPVLHLTLIWNISLASCKPAFGRNCDRGGTMVFKSNGDRCLRVPLKQILCYLG